MKRKRFIYEGEVIGSVVSVAFGNSLIFQEMNNRK